MNYFNTEYLQLNKKRELINSRKNRKLIFNKYNNAKYFSRGDILNVNFWAKTLHYSFEGICLVLKNKKILNPDITILLRNILYNTGIEVSVSYYYYRLYLNTKISDYKRKDFWYKSSKLYYLRDKENKASKIKN